MIDLFFPPACLLCERPLRVTKHPRLCTSCLSRMPTIKLPHCSRCLMPFETKQGTPHRCGACLRQGQFGRLFAFGWYDGGLAELLKQLKFGHRHLIAPTLGSLLKGIGDLEMTLPGYDCLVPVPLHRATLRRRGFNQAALIGAYVARDCRLRLDSFGLKKQRKTATQSKLNASQRSANVRGAFVAARSFHGESCLLIDDIYTTGSTAEACALALYRAGAMLVDVLTVARAV